MLCIIVYLLRSLYSPQVSVITQVSVYAVDTYIHGYEEKAQQIPHQMFSIIISQL